MVLPSVPVKATLLLAVKVLPLAIVRVAEVAGAVIATLLTDVAVAAPSVGVVRLGLVANTKAPVPVSSEMTPASSAEVVEANAFSLLLVVARVAVPAGIVTVPLPVAEVTMVVVPLEDPARVKPALPIAGVVRLGEVRVLLVKVSVVARPTKVSVEVGKVKVPTFEIVEITGLVRVLFVRVSVVALPTKVSVEVGSVSVPVLVIDAITGLVRVLFVSV